MEGDLGYNHLLSISIHDHVRPPAFEEIPGKHAASETRIWKENEKGWPQALKGPHGRTRGRLPAAYRHYIKVVLPSR